MLTIYLNNDYCALQALPVRPPARADLVEGLPRREPLCGRRRRGHGRARERPPQACRARRESRRGAARGRPRRGSAGGSVDPPLLRRDRQAGRNQDVDGGAGDRRALRRTAALRPLPERPCRSRTRGMSRRGTKRRTSALLRQPEPAPPRRQKERLRSSSLSSAIVALLGGRRTRRNCRVASGSSQNVSPETPHRLRSRGESAALGRRLPGGAGAKMKTWTLAARRPDEPVDPDGRRADGAG